MKKFDIVGEKVIDETEISKASILLYWLSVPIILVFFFAITVLPKIITASLAADFVENVDKSGVLERAFGSVGSVFVAIGLVVGAVLLLCWIVFCLVTTNRLIQNYFVITETFARGKSQKRELISPLKDVKDIFVEQSFFGHIFNYGSITVTAQKGSITIHNIKNPQRFRQFFLHNPDLFPGGGII